MSSRKVIALSACIIVAMIVGLTAHIIISEWTGPFIASLTEGFQRSSSPYPFLVTLAAYGTALLPVGVVVFLYYNAQSLLLIESKFLKTLVVACLLLGIKGDLLRQPFMNFLVNYNSSFDITTSFRVAILTQLDKWISNLLLALCVVYLCPSKRAINVES